MRPKILARALFTKSITSTVTTVQQQRVFLLASSRPGGYARDIDNVVYHFLSRSTIEHILQLAII